MDLTDYIKKYLKKLKILTIFWRRIFFVRNSFKASFFTKLRANFGGGFLADQWVLYSLDGRKKKEYLSEYDWYKSRYINEPFDFLLNNKVIATEVLGEYVYMPDIYFISSNGHTVNANGQQFTIDEVLQYLKEKGKVFIKPIDKGKGNGVNKIYYLENEYYMDEKKITYEALKKNLSDRYNWYISKGMEQHSYANALYDKTINTIRIITIKDPTTGKHKVFFAVQRIGTQKTIPVDNASKGGLVCKIDLDTGKLSKARSLKTLDVYDVHPDSNTRLEDVQIPNWVELKEEILNAARRLPYLHFIAWDVMKLPDGRNCVLEANTSSGVNIIQLWGGQRNGELGDFYEAHKVIKRRRNEEK